MATAITANLFGTFRLRRGAEDVRPRGRKTCALLAYLIACDGRSAPRARIADLLWGDRGEEQTRNSLRQALRELRASPVGPAITAEHGVASVLPCTITSDIERIEQAAARQDCAGMAKILSGMTGGFLDDLDGLSPGFDEWLQGERARQRDWLFAVALDCAAAQSGGTEAAERPLLAELARLDPLDEAVVRLRLQLDHAGGDVAALHRRYRRLSDDLSRELSVAPSRATRELFETLVAPTAVKQPVIVAPPAARDARTPPVVAVMPFQGDDAGTMRMAALLTDAVCASLSRNAEVRVVPVEASDTDRLQALSQRAVAAFALRCNVRDTDGVTTVTAQLSQVATGFLVWSEQLRTSASDHHPIDTLVERIVGAVSAGVERDVMSDLPNSHVGQHDAVASLYSHGKRIVREARTLATLEQGIAMLERVVDCDARHVGARLRLAQLNNTDYHYLLAGHDAEAMRARARRLTNEAAEIEPSSVRVQLRLAWCLLREGKWDRAGELFKAAGAMVGHDADAANECGFGLAQLGELDAARALIQRAFRLNPFAPAEYHADFAVLLTLAGEHDAAEAHFEVCGEQRLFWQIIRLSNLAQLSGSRAKLLALQQRFVTTFGEIWIRPQPPVLDDVLQWAATTFCFRDPAHSALIATGVTAAWFNFAPAMSDSNA